MSKVSFTPTPCRGGLFHRFIQQSRDASGIDEPRTSKSLVPEVASAEPLEASHEASPPLEDSQLERPTTSGRKVKKPPGAKGAKAVAKRKEPPQSEDNCDVGKMEVTAKTTEGVLHELSKRRKMVTKEVTSVTAVAPVDDLVTREGRKGRPQRIRCPVLASWKGEKQIYSREPGSATPHITGFQLVESQEDKAQREVPPIQGRGGRGGPRRRRKSRDGQEDQEGRSQPTDVEHKELPFPGAEPQAAAEDAEDAEPGAFTAAEASGDDGDEPMSLLPHHTMMPTKSLLRSSKESVQKTRKVRFAAQQKEFPIDKVPFSEELWEPMETRVRCDQCQQLFVWGKEIDHGNWADAKANHFEQVFCRGCQANALFACIGGWFLVSCACREAGFSTPASDVLVLVQELRKLGPHGRDPDPVWQILRLQEEKPWHEIMQKAHARIVEAFTIPEDLDGFEGGRRRGDVVHEVEDTDTGSNAEVVQVDG